MGDGEGEGGKWVGVREHASARNSGCMCMCLCICVSVFHVQVSVYLCVCVPSACVGRSRPNQRCTWKSPTHMDHYAQSTDAYMNARAQARQRRTALSCV